MVGLESSKLASLGGAPQVDPLGEIYFSAVPFRYGDHVAKFRLRPVSSRLTDLAGQDIDTRDRPDVIREAIRQEVSQIDGE